MKQIRENAFETNSSSSHSLVLSPDNIEYIPDTYFGIIDKEGTLFVNIKDVNFGWQWEIWNSAEEKLQYLYLDHKYNTQYIHDLEQLLIEKLSIVSVLWVDDDNYSNIDHQSNGTSYEITIDKAWDFLTNPHSVIRGGNDNEEGPWDYDEEDSYSQFDEEEEEEEEIENN